MDLRIKIGNLTFQNPIWVASGTFGYAQEFNDFLDLNTLGAIVTKTITLQPCSGNSPPRLHEAAAGLIDAIGLQNPGIDAYLTKYLPFLKTLTPHCICSIAGNTPDDYGLLAKKLSMDSFFKIIEVNLSCPNLDKNSVIPAQSASLTFDILTQIRHHFSGLMIAKLAPNVTDLTEIARAAQRAGAHALTIANSYPALAIDALHQQFLLGHRTGGLSGPAIKPLTQKLVWEVAKQVNLPIIGVGGIQSGLDVAEYLLCGAIAVQLGTINLTEPSAYARISREFSQYLTDKQLTLALLQQYPKK